MLLAIAFFFFNDTATTEIYTLSLHDALPISGHDLDALAEEHHAAQHDVRVEQAELQQPPVPDEVPGGVGAVAQHPAQDRKSTRLNSSHANISYAVFCLKKKKTQ